MNVNCDGSNKRPTGDGNNTRHKKSYRQSAESRRVSIERKKQCNSKALDIVTTFSEGTISEDCLLQNIKFINQEHYQDIVEERAINKHCGYPMCSKHLADIPRKQYHISTTYNKVFDITDRKNFCSNLCYKASKYLKDQISTSPLWLRETDSSVSYKLFPLISEGGTYGDEVNLGITSIKTDLDESLQSNNTCIALDNEIPLSTLRDNKTEKTNPISEGSCADSNVKNPESPIVYKKTNIPHSAVNDSSGVINVLPDQNDKVTLSNTKTKNTSEYFKVNNKIHDFSNNFHSKTDQMNSGKKYIAGYQSKLPNIVIKTEMVFKEWFSLNTFIFIFGENKVKELLKEQGSFIKTDAGTSMDSRFYEQYLAVCRKLNMLELEDMKIDSSFRDDAKNPLPDYNVLKEEAKKLDLKVKMFYKGDKIVHFEEDEENASNCESEKSTRAPILPIVDLHAQKALRRRIVTDNLRRVLQDIQKSLGLSGFNLTEDVRTLINTFTLSAHNITLKPVEWTLVAIFIIKLLSLKDSVLQQAFNSVTTKNHLTLLLMSYSLDGGYLDRLIVWLTDIEYMLQKNE